MGSNAPQAIHWRSQWTKFVTAWQLDTGLRRYDGKGKGETLRKTFVVFLSALLLPLSANAVCDATTYTKLEYIESTGTQWIDTGIRQIYQQPMKWEFSFKPTSLGGWMGGNAYTQIGITPLYGFSVGTKGVSRVVYDGTYNTVYYDDVYQYMASYDSGYNNLPITLFSLGYFVDTPYVNTIYNTYGLMYYAKIYDNTDTLVRDFVPVRRNSDGVLGMCDMVTGNFFTNSGTGEFVAGPAICDAGYWDNNGTCTQCPNGYYCPGDGSMIQCPANTHTPQEISELSGADLESSTNGWYVSSRYHTDYPDNISECNIAFEAGHIEGCTFYQLLYRWSVNTQNYEAFVGPRYFRGADNGYYLFNGTGYNYLGCTSCTNQIPLNSHYSGPGTPDVGNCPWACDSGYGQTLNNTCEQLCTAGVTGLHTSTGLVFNLYANKQTSPAIHVMPDGTNTVCYTSLAPGAANNAVNVEYNGATYHSID